MLFKNELYLLNSSKGLNTRHFRYSNYGHVHDFFCFQMVCLYFRLFLRLPTLYGSRQNMWPFLFTQISLFDPNSLRCLCLEQKMQFIATWNVVLLRVHQLSRHRKFFTQTKTVENMYMQQLCATKKEHHRAAQEGVTDCWKSGVDFRLDLIFIVGDPIKQLAPQPAVRTDMPNYKKDHPKKWHQT